MAAPQYVIAFITAGSEKEALKIAQTLVDERLAACCNVVRPVTSIYRWQGKVNRDEEALIILKTRKSLMKALISRVKQIHSYEVPEIIGVPIVEGNPAYMKWIFESTEKVEG